METWVARPLSSIRVPKPTQRPAFPHLHWPERQQSERELKRQHFWKAWEGLRGAARGPGFHQFAVEPSRYPPLYASVSLECFPPYCHLSWATGKTAGRLEGWREAGSGGGGEEGPLKPSRALGTGLT